MNRGLCGGLRECKRLLAHLGNGVELDSTPCIDFAPATDMTFSATPRVHDPKILMHTKMSSSSNSCARLSRQVNYLKKVKFNPLDFNACRFRC